MDFYGIIGFLVKVISTTKKQLFILSFRPESPETKIKSFTFYYPVWQTVLKKNFNFIGRSKKTHIIFLTAPLYDTERLASV